MNTELPVGVVLVDNLIFLFQKCRQHKDLHQVKLLHTFMCQQHLESHDQLGNQLVPALVQCGSLPDAQHVFDRLPHPNCHSWNALICGYADSEKVQHAFCLYHRMQQAHIVQPDRCTYLALLNACAKHKFTETTGRRLHCEIVKRAYERYVFFDSPMVGNTLVDMYGKHGSHADAQRVFDGLPVRDTVSWNVLITGYADGGLRHEVERCFHQMQLDGMSPDSVTYISCLKACSTLGDLLSGLELHTEICKRGLERELYLGSTLLDMYTKCGSLKEAQQVFGMLPVRNTVSWAALITAYAEHGVAEELVNIFHEMQLEGVSPDSVTIICSLKACGVNGALEPGLKMHAEMVRRGFEGDPHASNTLVDMYTKCGALLEAYQVFERLPVRDAVSWNAMLAGYAAHGLDEEVLIQFKKMQLEHVPATDVTFILCLKACGTVGALATGRQIHGEIRVSGLEGDLYVCSILIGMYGRCASVGEGREVFDKLPVRDTVLYNAMIKAYGENHKGTLAVECFEDMQEQGVKPDSITFICVLTACSHESLVAKGQKLFTVMIEEYGIEPSLDHYACMVDLLARSGHVYKAEKLLAAMDCCPSAETLLTLLNACKIYGKVELGERCFQQLVELSQEDASAFVLMADLYTSAGRWKDANKIEVMRIYIEAKKKLGSASIEVNEMLHEFVVGVKQVEDLLGVLDFRCMKHEGYVPSLDLFSRYRPIFN